MTDEDRRSLLKAKIDAVRLDFTERVPARLRALRDEVLTALETDETTPVPWDSIRTEAHRLAGAGTTFGRPAVSETAAELERCIERIETAPRPWPPSLVAAIRNAATALGGLAAGSTEDPFSSE